MKTERNLTIDFAKAMAIILVVVGHWDPVSAPFWWKDIWKVIYSFHMPLFMVASGFLYRLTLRPERTYPKFLLSKVKRLLVPYAVTSVLIISFKLLTQGHASVENPVTLYSYMAILWSPSAGYFLWFIWALWWMFVLVPLFKSNRARVVLFCLSIPLAYIPMKAPELFCLRQTQEMLFYFMLGVMLAQYPRMYNRLLNVPAILPLGLFAALEAMMLCHIPYIWYTLSFAGIYASLKLANMIVESPFEVLKQRLGKLSAATYIIYLFHTTFEGMAKSILWHWPMLIDGENGWLFLLSSCIVVSVGVIVPLWLFSIFSRYKLTRKLFGL